MCQTKPEEGAPLQMGTNSENRDDNDADQILGQPPASHADGFKSAVLCISGGCYVGDVFAVIEGPSIPKRSRIKAENTKQIA